MFVEKFEACGRRAIYKFRLFLARHKGDPGSTEQPKDRDDREISSLQQYYLLFHHVGYYFWLLSKTAWEDSFLSDSHVLFYYILVMFTLSLDVYSFACGPPGFVAEEPADSEGLFFCNVCQRHCPVRSMHCRTCKMCVHRRDHHCPWTGTCVGRDNHLMFLMFLLCEVLVMIPVNFTIWRGLFVRKPVLHWIRDNFGTLVIATVCGFDAFLVSGLLQSHVTLLLHNVTTWEVSRRDKIDYMREYPIGVSPFDRGRWENAKEFFTMAQTKKTWAKPPPPTLQAMFNEREVMCNELGVDDDELRPPILSRMIATGI